MLNVGRLITSPNFTQSVTITRTTGDWNTSNGKFETTTSTLTLPAIVKPLSTRELTIQPEADRVSGMINVYTLSAVYPTRPTGLSDEVTWRGEQYKVSNMADYSDYGYYKATCVRKLST